MVGPAVGKRPAQQQQQAPFRGRLGDSVCGSRGLQGGEASNQAAGKVDDGVFFSHWISQDAILQNRELWLLIKNKFGFYSQSQYRKWQRKLAEDSTWPPTDRTDYSGDGQNGFYINRGYESTEQIPKEKLQWGGQTTERHFWTRL